MDNHFIPRFYLSRWSTESGLWEYRLRRGGHIQGDVRFPKGTGYKRDLYKNTGIEGEDSHTFETRFLKQHDDLAARALSSLEKTGSATDEEICGWISFIIALQIRHPNDIEVYRREYAKRWLSEFGTLQEQYRSLRGDDDPEHVCSYIEKRQPGTMEKAMFQLLRKLMQHQDIGQLLIEFEHAIVSLKSDIELLTSDRPVLMTSTLTEADAYVILPVGPKKLYVAGKTRSTLDRLLNKTGDDMVAIVNDQVCRHGSFAAYSRIPGLDAYVQDRLGTRVYDSWFTRVSRNFENKNEVP